MISGVLQVFYHTAASFDRLISLCAMQDKMQRIQSAVMLAALAVLVEVSSASVSPAMHPGFSAVLRSRSLERFEPKVRTKTPARVQLSPLALSRAAVRGLAGSGQTAGQNAWQDLSHTALRALLREHEHKQSRTHRAPAGARGYGGIGKNRRSAADRTGLCAEGGGAKHRTQGGTCTFGGGCCCESRVLHPRS